MDTLVSRIAALEEEVANIKSLVAPTQSRSRLLQYPRGLAKFLLSYWVLLSFAVAFGTVVYVKYAFDIDYFEQYRNQSTTKRLSEMYRQLGDRMLSRLEWESAVSAYREALQIDHNNAAATSGLVKAHLPEAPQKLVAPEVIDVKLQHLDELFPNDYQVLFLKAIRSQEMGDYEVAEKLLLQSIAANPNFSGAYLQLGYMAHYRFDLEGAIENYDKALKLDPQSSTANNNLGFMNLLSGRYEEAVKYLSRSDSIAPRFLTAINLGDAYRYMGDHVRATQVHEAALRNAMRAEEEDRYFGGEWTYNFMPVADGDTQTIKRFIWARTRDQKLAIGHFALALDHAMARKFSDANGELDDALRLERRGGAPYREFYVNKIAFMQRFPKLDDRTKEWFATQRAKLGQ